MAVTLVLYLPLVLAVHLAADTLLGDGGPAGQATALAALWLAFTGFMAIRGALFWWRVRSDHWVVTGASR
jgi:Na+-driven multidrug efflux pump